MKSGNAKACRRCDLFTVVAAERDHRKMYNYKGSENADSKSVVNSSSGGDKALSRVGDIPEGSWICLSHRILIGRIA